VMHHSAFFIVVSTLALLALSYPVLSMKLGSSGPSALPKDTKSAQANESLRQLFGEGMRTPINLIITAGTDAPVEGDTLNRIQRMITQMDGVLSMERVSLSNDLSSALFRVYMKYSDESEEGRALVTRIEHSLPNDKTGKTMQVAVGGTSSEFNDFTKAVTDNLISVIVFVMISTFLVLMVLFRSLLIPFKAVFMTLLSTLAAYGVLVMVFQWGWWGGLLGVENLGHVTNWVPPFLFCILFGLSMDYEVFLLSRIKERRDGTPNLHNRETESVAWGLAQTAPTITAAAAIMIVTFICFFTNRLIPMKELSLGLGVAIFIDATIVRMCLVPALMNVAGKWNWWMPRWMEKLIPNLHISH
jgi:uncharacterized membrane protein YdfJ with MMPL/SSD domain